MNIITHRIPKFQVVKENLKGRYFIMEEYMRLFKEYIGEDRHTYTKTMFKITGTLYRAVSKGRITWEQGLEKLNSLGGAN